VRILWAPLAIERAHEAADYIAEASPMAADRWLDRRLEAVGQLEHFPFSGRVVLDEVRSR
jgi:plasmid stabilization system protein ParE